MLDKMDANITQEIKTAYDEMTENEFFEHMDAESVEVDDIKKALGDGVVNEYMQWIYVNIK